LWPGAIEFASSLFTLNNSIYPTLFDNHVFFMLMIFFGLFKSAVAVTFAALSRMKNRWLQLGLRCMPPAGGVLHFHPAKAE
jgi:hypothetical protein